MIVLHPFVVCGDKKNQMKGFGLSQVAGLRQGDPLFPSLLGNTRVSWQIGHSHDSCLWSIKLWPEYFIAPSECNTKYLLVRLTARLVVF